MNEPDSQRVELAISRLQDGLRVGEIHNSQQRAVTLAEQLAEIEFDSDLRTRFDAAAEFKADQVDLTVDTVRRLRKTSEIVEDDLGVDVGHSRFTKVATCLSTLSSLGSIAIAGQNLILASTNLLDAYREVETLEKVEEQRYTTFYKALGVFVIDCMLFTTPLNYKTAWFGTRFINNRFLYQLRSVSPNLHRYALSEIHYVIRGIPPKVLTGPVHYSEYLVSVTVNTFNMLWEFGPDNIGVEDIPTKVDELVREFREFINTTYNISLPELDWESLYADILGEVKDLVDISLLSVDEMMTHLERSPVAHY